MEPVTSPLAMPLPSISKARVRTRTGCLECRKRRKKCDEHHPSCDVCIRQNTQCTWPTDTNQPVDGRRRGGRRWKHPVAAEKALFQPYDYPHMYSHFATAVMPRLLRPGCPPEYSDQSHILRLAPKFPPLMAIMVATAAVDVGDDRLAMDGYMFSLRSLRDSIGSADGHDEDGILATTICLCVFENLRSDAPPAIGPHATAAGLLLSKRSPCPISKVPQATANFERTCAESILYHSALMMLFDPSMDVLGQVGPTGVVLRYLHASPNEPGLPARPILDMSYPFFILVADVTRLARLSRPLDEAEHRTWMRLQSAVMQYEQTLSGDPMADLYTCAMRILLLRVDRTRSALERHKVIQNLFAVGLATLLPLDLRIYLRSYSLWPVAVLASIARETHEQRLVSDKIAQWVSTRCGQALRLQERLRKIWNSPEGDPESVLLRRIGMLWEGG